MMEALELQTFQRGLIAADQIQNLGPFTSENDRQMPNKPG